MTYFTKNECNYQKNNKTKSCTKIFKNELKNGLYGIYNFADISEKKRKDEQLIKAISNDLDYCKSHRTYTHLLDFFLLSDAEKKREWEKYGSIVLFITNLIHSRINTLKEASSKLVGKIH
jgi:hypothetical protein